MIRSSLLVAFTNVQHSKAQIAIYDYLLPRGDNLYIGSSNLPTFICLPCSNIAWIQLLPMIYEGNNRTNGCHLVVFNIDTALACNFVALHHPHPSSL